MCGINGIFGRHPRETKTTYIQAMNGALSKRGPDDSGYMADNEIALGQTRLSIIDISEHGHQPFFSPDQRYCMVFNGEIYNYTEFYNELKAKGYTFSSRSDTEVLLNLYIEYGASMLNRLNGMFAFAVWDNLKKELFIARDRTGVKPLYYTQHKDNFYFSSEPKAIYKTDVPFELNEQFLPEWLMFRYVAGTESLHKTLKRLLPGHYIHLTSQNILVKRWYHLGERILQHASISNPKEWFFETFHSAVKYRMVSDVPVGILLSGGLDSSSVAAMVKHSGFSNIDTFNVGFGDFELDESKIAGRFSKELGFNFHTRQFRKQDLKRAIEESTIAMDQPLIHGNEPMIFAISEYARTNVKVLLSGEGADEILGGYVRYKAIRSNSTIFALKTILKLIPGRYKPKRIAKLERYLHIGSQTDMQVYNACNFYPADLEKIGVVAGALENQYRLSVLEEARQTYPGNHKKQLLYLDQHTFLQSLNERNDTSTMRASIECREPFQDYRLAEGTGKLANEWLFKGKKSKFLMVDALGDLLPHYIKTFKKIGFVAPMPQYIQEDESLRKSFADLKESPIFNIDFFSRLDKNKLFNDPANYLLLQQLWFFDLWYKHQKNEPVF